MQDLMKVDGITVSSEEDEGGLVRTRRKEVVKFIQSLIDKVDQIHHTLNVLDLESSSKSPDTVSTSKLNSVQSSVSLINEIEVAGKDFKRS